MEPIKKAGSALSLAGLVFLLFLFFFEGYLHIPSWLQLVGRMHPLMLHFPIVLLVMSLLSYWVPPNTFQSNGWELIRLFAALTALLSAIMGMLLSIEQADKGELLVYHKWAGVSLAIIAWLLYSFHEQIIRHATTAKALSVFTMLVLLVTGHWGATLTHGENFLMAPVMSAHKKIINPEKAEIFADIIYPVFQEKCGSCHQAHNQKGGLSLNDSATILAGGKSGKALVPGNLLQSLFITRLHLPMNDKKHMPLAEKPQLSEEEMNVLEAWVKAGAPFRQKLTDRPVNDSLRITATAYISTQTDITDEVSYDFTAADDATINKLNNNYRVIKPLGRNSPALAVSFFGKAQYTAEKLKELDPLKQQIIHLNLSNMPVTDEQVKWISTLPNLRRLNLNYSDITNQSMPWLAGMKNLISVSVTGTAISLPGLQALLASKKLTEIYIWNSKVTAAEAASLKQKNQQVSIETGFNGADTTILALNKPFIKTPEGFFHDSVKVVLAHVIKGVELRYTLDGADPDSGGTSFVYQAPIPISQNTQLAVKAYKKGWLPSELAKSSFLKAGIPVVKTTLLTPPDPKYNALAEKVLTDLELGETDDFNSKWLGYQKNDALVVFDLGAPHKVQELTVEALYSIRASIMPPEFLTVWGSNDGKSWTLLSTLIPEKLKKIVKTEIHPFRLQFHPVHIRYIKLQGKPIKKLPNWHPNKKKPGWFFMTEVVIN